jgi:2-C-methyl-D-erythritol 4-phosphate cytidylyltransferase
MTLAAASITPPRLFALVPCAGVGERAGAGGPKQYALLAGRSLVAHTLLALQGVQRLAGTLVVLSSEDNTFEASVPGFAGWISREGGATRAHTVANGLHALVAHGAALNDWVLVHDAARCLVRAEWIDTLIDACLPDGDGGLLALPVADTLKSERGGFVTATVDRRAMWQAQTPQMFRIGPLQEALARAGAGVTDEASAMEAAGHAPRLVPGSLENFKVTYPDDFDLAERLLRTRA